MEREVVGGQESPISLVKKRFGKFYMEVMFDEKTLNNHLYGCADSFRVRDSER